MGTRPHQVPHLGTRSHDAPSNSVSPGPRVDRIALDHFFRVRMAVLFSDMLLEREGQLGFTSGNRYTSSVVGIRLTSAFGIRQLR